MGSLPNRLEAAPTPRLSPLKDIHRWVKKQSFKFCMFHRTKRERPLSKTEVNHLEPTSLSQPPG